ncbi:two-component sensor histidine kinase [Thalassotalea loyana]|uniref:histidine kinase n=1 Tax=Thalassotalea loyana TaxID=280483 RepID=A0ABQ6HFB4_9GAMM|nr:ATP-binding protein [Thalassotalea loyana]GLX86104.1 two-component sensor histidine kinase [Thalassotalea loyana]
MKPNSIRTRLIASALLIIIVTLPIIGFALNQAFESKLKNALQQELSAYVYSILAVADVENQQLFMPDQLLENQFNVSQSGLYALISQSNASGEDKTLWQSESLLTMQPPKTLMHPELGGFAFYNTSIDNQAHAIYSFSVSFVDQYSEFPFTVHIVKDLSNFAAVNDEFQQELWLWLAALMAFFMLVQGVWLYWSLKPLNTLKNELNAIENGTAISIESTYPQELEQATQQLNTLLETEQSQRTRYRNSLSDLAHSLKAPLAVIQSQPDLSNSSREQLQTLHQMIEHQLKRAQVAGESSWHLGVTIKPIAEKLTNTMGKLHPDTSIALKLNVSAQATFKGDEVDLMEILGNLLDNACKAAKSTVVFSITATQSETVFCVEDDGLGVSEELKHTILSRGTRADTYEKGHGIGLAIVRDLVSSYQGNIHITNSSSLSGASFSVSFSH